MTLILYCICVCVCVCVIIHTPLSLKFVIDPGPDRVGVFHGSRGANYGDY